MKPDWKDAPSWATWLGMYQEGLWGWYTAEPTMENKEPRTEVKPKDYSIIHFDVTLRVKKQKQLNKVILWLVKNNYDFSWEYIMGDSYEGSTYELEVYDVPWANNLKRFAKVLKKCDKVMP